MLNNVCYSSLDYQCALQSLSAANILQIDLWTLQDWKGKELKYGAQVFHKIRSHLKTPGARMLT